MFVAPLHRIRGELWAWLGLREEWSDEAAPRRRRRRFSFRSSALTVHFGYLNYLEKPQMFRAEWAGGALSADDMHQAKSAGHPHWQFDALESSPSYAAEVKDLLVLLREATGAAASRDFIPGALAPEDHGEMTDARNRFSRLHFASAAAWWRPAPDNVHVHAPASVQELESWLRATVDYTLGELKRL